MKTYKCKEIYCLNEITRQTFNYRGGRCKSCARKEQYKNPENHPMFGRKGELSPAWKGNKAKYRQKHYCIDCNKELKTQKAKRCNSCANKLNNLKRIRIIKPKKVYYCIDNCTKEVSGKNKRCYSCNMKYRYSLNKKWITGENNPFYGKHHTKETRKKLSLINGGTGIPGEKREYGIEFNSNLKEQIRYRDNYKCQLCGFAEIEYNKKLDIHHIDSNKKNNNINNLIALCRRCHIRIRYNKITIDSRGGIGAIFPTNILRDLVKEWANKIKIEET